MMDGDSKQDILKEISAIRALLTQLQPVSGNRKPQQSLREDTATGEKRVLILF